MKDHLSSLLSGFVAPNRSAAISGFSAARISSVANA